MGIIKKVLGDSTIIGSLIIAASIIIAGMMISSEIYKIDNIGVSVEGNIAAEISNYPGRTFDVSGCDWPVGF